MTDFSWSSLHFIRPLWLIGFIPLVGLIVYLLSRDRGEGLWKKICDVALLPYVLVSRQQKFSKLPEILFSLTLVLALLAAAGPAWKRLPQPLFSNQSPLVIVLDLSLSMNAMDIKASRLKRAKLKIEDLLNRRRDGQTALVVYAGHAFIVTPLTQDIETIRLQLSDIETSLMPVQGSAPAMALDKAYFLMKNAEVTSGEILLISDEVTDRTLVEKAGKLAKENIRVSVLAVGTKGGAPIPRPQGGFVFHNGSIVMTKTNFDYMKKIADAGNGQYHAITLDGADINAFINYFKSNGNSVSLKLLDFKADIWYEEGPWLFFLILPLAALAFRKGWIMVFLIFLLPMPQAVYAFEWNQLWLNQNQQAQKEYSNKGYEDAAKKFTNPAWKAAALYKAGNLKEALILWEHIKTSNGFYNKGNAMARMGMINEAIKAYDQALLISPHHQDAKYNRKLLKELLKRQGNYKGGNKDSKKAGQKQGKKGQDSPEPGTGKSSGQANKRQQKQATKGLTRKPSSQNQKGGGQKGGFDGDGPGSSTSTLRKPKDQKTSDAKNAKKEKTSDNKKSKEKDNKLKNKMKKAGKPTDNKNSSSEQDQAFQQWLRRVPDDPGGLLRNRFFKTYSEESDRGYGQNVPGQQW